MITKEKLNKEDIKNRNSINLAGLIRGYFDLGGMQVQFNVISTEILRDAQINPQKYKDLLVRVAGYSAFFIELDPRMQQDIINRTEHYI